jgi:RimJ/RimL family protein N-acetyltransferase/predicted N-acetyltransferase YhbS
MPEQRVRLRPITEADLPDYVRWFNDPEATGFYDREAGTVTLDGEREWLSCISAPDCRERHWAIEAEGRHIGRCALVRDRNPAVAKAGLGIIIGDKSAWGRGYGPAALRELLRIGFEDMYLHRIQLTVFPENRRALRCYAKCGFRQEGFERQSYLKGGRWRDLITMAILREEWEARQHSVGDGDDLLIRAFEMADYDDVVEVWRAAGLSIRPSDTLEEVARKQLQSPDLFLVAFQGSQMVGTALGAWDGWRGGVYRVAVRPDCRRRGIGRALMGELESRLRSEGALFLNLCYYTDDEPAREFYRALGYETADGVAFASKALQDVGGSREPQS